MKQIILLFFALSFLMKGIGQIVINPTLTPITLVNGMVPGDQVYCNAMVQVGSRNLWAISYRDPSTGTGTIHVRSTVGAGSSINIAVPTTCPDQQGPQIAIADDPGAGGSRYILLVTYLNTANIPTFRAYRLNGVTTGSLSASVIHTSAITVSPFTTEPVPKIDVFADPVNLISGIPRIHEFAIAYSDNSNVTAHVLKGNVSSLGTWTSYLATTWGSLPPGFQNISDIDIAVATEIPTNTQYAFLSIEIEIIGTTFSVPGYIELDMNTSISTGWIQLIFSGGTGTIPQHYSQKRRPNSIEAYSIIDLLSPLSAGSHYLLATMGDTTASFTNREIYLVNMVNGLAIDGFFTGIQHAYPVTAAGIGPSWNSGWGVGKIGNDQYTTAWLANDGNIYSKSTSQDPVTNFMTTSINFHKINNVAASPANDHRSLKITSSDNSGDKLLVAWVDDISDRLLYKLIGNTYAFKPTSTSELSKSLSECTAYPNPTTNEVTIDIGENPSGHLTIVNMLGQIVQTVVANGQKTVLDMRNLSSGMYMINYIVGNEILQTLSVLKQ